MPHDMPHPTEQDIFCTKAEGYRGIWHGQTPTHDEYVYKYSGGLGTYPHQSRPFAVYRAEVNKTFFCWGGTVKDFSPYNQQYGANQLLHMVSYYDHDTGQVPRPTILFDKYCGDAHDNPVIAIDDDGYTWIFSPSHGQWTTPSYIHRSVEPYAIDAFETIHDDWLFAYPQIWHDDGFIFMHTAYDNGRKLRCATSPDGMTWQKTVRLAEIEQGHYQVTAAKDSKIVTAFNYHPAEGGLEARTNLYVMQSFDRGETWQTIDGQLLDVPLMTIDNRARIRNYRDEDLLVYMKDIEFDVDGNPIILYITSKGNLPGTQNNPRTWTIAHWLGAEWAYHTITTSDSNYDMGSLYIEADQWKLIAPTQDGHFAFNPGGEVAVWTSDNRGKTWHMKSGLTRDSKSNHTFIRRPVNAHPDFYALWADGNPREPSTSCLYFTNLAGDGVWQLPFDMSDDFATPKRIK